MNQDERRRFEALKSPWCSAELMNEIYALDLSADERLRSYFQRSRPEIIRVETTPTGEERVSVHRYRLETIIQANRLLPRKWAAAKVGMTERSLEATISKLSDAGVLYKHYVWPQLIDKDFDELVRLFHELKFRTFGTFNSFCQTIHSFLPNILV